MTRTQWGLGGGRAQQAPGELQAVVTPSPKRSLSQALWGSSHGCQEHDEEVLGSSHGYQEHDEEVPGSSHGCQEHDEEVPGDHIPALAQP